MTKCIRRYNTPMEVFQYLGQPVDEWPEWLQEMKKDRIIDLVEGDGDEPYLLMRKFNGGDEVKTDDYILIDEDNYPHSYTDTEFEDLCKKVE